MGLWGKDKEILSESGMVTTREMGTEQSHWIVRLKATTMRQGIAETELLIFWPDD